MTFDPQQSADSAAAAPLATTNAPLATAVMLAGLAALHVYEMRPLLTVLPLQSTVTPSRAAFAAWVACVVLLTANGPPAYPQLVVGLLALLGAAWMSHDTLVYSMLFGGTQEHAAVLSCSAVPADRRAAGETLLSRFVSLLMLGSAFVRLFDVPGAAKAAAAYDPLVAAWGFYGILSPYVDVVLGAAHLAGHPSCLLPMAVTTGATAYGALRAVQEGRRVRCACVGTAVGKTDVSWLTVAEYGLMFGVTVSQLYRQTAPSSSPLRKKPPSRTQETQETQSKTQETPDVPRFEEM